MDKFASVERVNFATNDTGRFGVDYSSKYTEADRDTILAKLNTRAVADSMDEQRRKAKEMKLQVKMEEARLREVKEHG